MDEKRQLIDQLRSRKRKHALAALEIIREQGWLTDGSLMNTSLYGAKLEGADLRDANLSGATLSGVDFKGADLRGAKLSNADMIDSDLRDAMLRHVDLHGTDLIASKLTNVDFTGADLRGASVGGSTLSFAKFHFTLLAYTNFKNAICDNTVFAEVDLSEAIGLETVRHFGPSELGLNTLLKSQGLIPDVFLRGAGVSEAVIMALPTFLKQPNPYASCFISYTRPDRDYAQQLLDALRIHGVRCWLHEHQVQENVDFYKATNRHLQTEHKIVLVTSDMALASWWLEPEVELALSVESKGNQAMLLPISLDDSLENYQGIYADELRSRLITEQSVAFEAQLAMVLQALKL